MTVKIGWLPFIEKIKKADANEELQTYFGWVENAAYPPEVLDTWQDSSGAFLQCPAFFNYVNQTWVLKAWQDVELIHERGKGVRSSLSKIQHDTLIDINPMFFDVQRGYPILTLKNAFVFVADKPVWIEALPAFNNLNPALRLIPGHFNIGAWQRPVFPTFEMIQDRVIIKRGDPLMYIRFKTANINEMFKLERLERTEEIDHSINSCLSLKNFVKGLSWVIASRGWNKARPKSFFKK